jgi:hypothetical protein
VVNQNDFNAQGYFGREDVDLGVGQLPQPSLVELSALAVEVGEPDVLGADGLGDGEGLVRAVVRELVQPARELERART